jgi:hypothetical protein
MTDIIAAARKSPVRPETNASTERRITKGFIKARPKSR